MSLWRFVFLSMAMALALAAAQDAPPFRDSSPHRTQFVTIAKDVRLEVLDWGGTGRPLVFLAGYLTSHAYDDIAPKLTANAHVYGITRRGLGASSRPPTGYTARESAEDVLHVLDTLKLDKPILAGHSFGALLLERTFQNAAISQLTAAWPWGESNAMSPVNPLPFDTVLLVNSAAPSIYAKQLQGYLAAHRQAMLRAHVPRARREARVDLPAARDGARIGTGDRRARADGALRGIRGAEPRRYVRGAERRIAPPRAVGLSSESRRARAHRRAPL